MPPDSFINYRDTCRRRVSAGTAVPTQPRNGRRAGGCPAWGDAVGSGGVSAATSPLPGGDSQSPPSRAPALIGRVAAAEAAARGRAAAAGAGGGRLTFHRAGLGLLPPGHVRAPWLVLLLLVFLLSLPSLPLSAFSLAPPPPAPPNFARRSGSSGIDYLIFSLLSPVAMRQVQLLFPPPRAPSPGEKKI